MFAILCDKLLGVAALPRSMTRARHRTAYGAEEHAGRTAAVRVPDSAGGPRSCFPFIPILGFLPPARRAAAGRSRRPSRTVEDPDDRAASIPSQSVHVYSARCPRGVSYDVLAVFRR